MAGDPPFHTTQTNAVEFPGPASLRFLKGAGLDAPPPPTTANDTPQIVAASEYQRCPSAGGAPGGRGRVGQPNIRTVVLYASSPTRKVVGEFTIDSVLTLRLDALWGLTEKGGAIERSYFDQYFRGRTVGHALKVKKVRRYKFP